MKIHNHVQSYGILHTFQHMVVLQAFDFCSDSGTGLYVREGIFIFTERQQCKKVVTVIIVMDYVPIHRNRVQEKRHMQYPHFCL